MNFRDTIPWDIIDAPIPDNFFGDDAVRVNLIRHGIKNGIITQSRVLDELREEESDTLLTPNSKYKTKVSNKMQWIEEYYFPRCLLEIKWFEAKWGDDVRRTMLIAREKFKNFPKEQQDTTDKMGYYPKGVAEL